MATITFCRTSESLKRRAAEAATGVRPYLLERAPHIRGAIEALERGQDVIAIAAASSVGWRAPQGTSVAFDDDMKDDNLLSMQCAGRIPGSFAMMDHQQKAVDEAVGWIGLRLQSLSRIHRPGRPQLSYDAVVSLEKLEAKKDLDTPDPTS